MRARTSQSPPLDEALLQLIRAMARDAAREDHDAEIAKRAAEASARQESQQ